MRIKYHSPSFLERDGVRLSFVNEEKPAGEYEVEFNISHLPGWISAKGGYASGIYFYQLRVYTSEGGVEDYVKTKKMILIK